VHAANIGQKGDDGLKEITGGVGAGE